MTEELNLTNESGCQKGTEESTPQKGESSEEIDATVITGYKERLNMDDEPVPKESQQLEEENVEVHLTPERAASAQQEDV